MIKMTKDTQKQAGFSLVEVLLVIIIIGFIVVLIGNVPSSLRLTGSSNHQSIAKQIAIQQIEDLRLKTYANLANGTTTISDPRLGSMLVTAAAITIADCPVNICPNGEKAKAVNIKISWLEGNKTNDVQLDTIISDGGLR